MLPGLELGGPKIRRPALGKRAGGRHMSGFARMLGRRHVRALTIVAIALAAVLPAGRAQAAPSQADCDARPNNTIPKMLECMRVGQVRAHQAALQAIANANGGNRFAGLAGHNESVNYVMDTLEAAGWDVSLQEFDYTVVPRARPLGSAADGAGLDHIRRGHRLRRDRPVRSRGRHRCGHGRRPPVRTRKHVRRAAARRRTSRASPPGTSRCSSAASAPSS